MDGTSADIPRAPAENLVRDRFRYPELVGERPKQLQMIAARKKIRGDALIIARSATGEFAVQVVEIYLK